MMHGIVSSSDGANTTFVQRHDRSRGGVLLIISLSLVSLICVMWVLGGSSFSDGLMGFISCACVVLGVVGVYQGLCQVVNSRRYQIVGDVLTITEGPIPHRPAIRLEQPEIERIYLTSYKVYNKHRGMIPVGLIRADTEIGLEVDLTPESEDLAQLQYLAEQLRAALVVPEGQGFGGLNPGWTPAATSTP